MSFYLIIFACNKTIEIPMKILNSAFLLCFLIFSLASCKNKPEVVDEDAATYFSIKQFLDDQWKNREGIPYSLTKISTMNGITDSAYIGLDSVVWKNIRAKFDPTDISDTKFLDQYDISSFEEESMDFTTLRYEAKTKKQFTQIMNIDIDNFNNRVRSIYIETLKENSIYKKTEKLLYIPDDLIQIQEFEKSVVSPEKNTKISFRFL